MSKMSLSERRTRVARKMKTVNAAFSKFVSCTYIMFIGREGERVCVHIICIAILMCMPALVFVQ